MSGQVLENKIYNIRPGDTLLQIARMTGVEYEDLLALNPHITNPNLIYPGDAILLPASVSRQQLIVDASQAIFTDDEPLWLKIARHELGVTEWEPGNNPRILEYLATTPHLPKAARMTDATAWCSAFANWAIRMAGLSGTDSAWALDWQNWGAAISSPQAGAVVVFSRDSQSQKGGHVGFYIDETDTDVTILGGNQGNSVSISSFPKNGVKGSFTYRLRAIRWPS